MRSFSLALVLCVLVLAAEATMITSHRSKLHALKKKSGAKKGKTTLDAMSSQGVLALVKDLQQVMKGDDKEGKEGKDKGKDKDKESGKEDTVKPIIHDGCECVTVDPCDCRSMSVKLGPVHATEIVEDSDSDIATIDDSPEEPTITDELPGNVKQVDNVPVTMVQTAPAPHIVGSLFPIRRYPSIDDLAAHAQSLLPDGLASDTDLPEDDGTQDALDSKISELESSISNSHDLQGQLSDSLKSLVDLLTKRKDAIVEKTKTKAEENIATEKSLLEEITGEIKSLDTMAERLKGSIEINEKIVANEDSDEAAEGAEEAAAF